MAEWKEQQMIDKACEWLKDMACYYANWECNSDTYENEIVYDTEKLIEDFKKSNGGIVMTQYIDKDALVAMMKKIYNEDYKFLPSDIVEHIQDFKDDVLINIDTLEVKEVDLEKELDVYFDTHDYEFVFDDYIELAKYFFELGLKTQKGK